MHLWEHVQWSMVVQGKAPHSRISFRKVDIPSFSYIPRYILKCEYKKAREIAEEESKNI